MNQSFLFSVTTSLKKEVLDAEGRTICETLGQSGIKGVLSVATAKTYFLEIQAANLSEASQTAQKVAGEFLCNPVSHVFQINQLERDSKSQSSSSVESRPQEGLR